LNARQLRDQSNSQTVGRGVLTLVYDLPSASGPARQDAAPQDRGCGPHRYSERHSEHPHLGTYTPVTALVQLVGRTIWLPPMIRCASKTSQFLGHPGITRHPTLPDISFLAHASTRLGEGSAVDVPCYLAVIRGGIGWAVLNVDARCCIRTTELTVQFARAASSVLLRSDGSPTPTTTTPSHH
jgi:hypothetical protein